MSLSDAQKTVVLELEYDEKSELDLSAGFAKITLETFHVEVFMASISPRNTTIVGEFWNAHALLSDVTFSPKTNTLFKEAQFLIASPDTVERFSGK